MFRVSLQGYSHYFYFYFTMVQSNLSNFYSGKLASPILVSCRESIMETKQSFYGKFYIGPLSVGQGLTVANALRRTLLSELVGVAITSVSIEGVTHEYSTLNGVRESVLDILLNLKQIVLKSKQALKRPQTAYLYCQGPGVIRAGDLILPPTVQCVDPEQYIATLSSNGFLKMKLIIRQGKNYLVQTPNSQSSFFAGKTPKRSESDFNLDSNQNHKKSRVPSGKTLFHEAKAVGPLFKYKVAVNEQKNGKTNSLSLVQQSPSLSKFTKKKLNTLVFKNPRSLTNLFENSKNKELFLHLFKKQILSILVVKMSGTKFNNPMETATDQEFGKLPFSQVPGTFDTNRHDFFSGLLVSGGAVSSMFFNPKTKTKALFIDAVFMPVTKVNYILEESRQKFFDSFDVDSLKELSMNSEPEKSEFGDSGFDLNFGHEKKKWDRSKDKRKRESVFGSSKKSELVLGKGDSSVSLFDNPLVQEQESGSVSSALYAESGKNQNKTNLAFYFKKNWLNSKQSWSLFSSEFNTILFDNFNNSPKDIIILEIWTNGSILPRTALQQAAQHLSNLFVKFENAKIMTNNFVATNKTYTQTIQKLYERYKKL